MRTWAAGGRCEVRSGVLPDHGYVPVQRGGQRTAPAGRAHFQRNTVYTRKGWWEIRSKELNDNAKQYWFYYLLPILEILGIPAEKGNTKK